MQGFESSDPFTAFIDCHGILPNSIAIKLVLCSISLPPFLSGPHDDRTCLLPLSSGRQRETRGDRSPHALSQSNFDSRITMKVYMVWRGRINLEISHKAPFAAVFNYAIRLAGRDDKSGGYMAGNHILRLRRTSQCRLATTLRANYVTLFAFATSFSP